MSVRFLDYVKVYGMLYKKLSPICHDFPFLCYMSETVYIETSILGYLTARPSRDIVIAANIEVTRGSAV
ncbi:MAG: hypothetical protein SFT94_00360 [Pseudanabaenaceae cyanobacterium bins.68]|nr:hypothetical protein [Pseudanabaenaceae cyanobacterium bins.68]